MEEEPELGTIPEEWNSIFGHLGTTYIYMKKSNILTPKKVENVAFYAH